MLSSGRNSRRPRRALGVAAAASLLLGAAARADESHFFVLTVYSNVKGGNALVSGDYAEAIRQLGSTRLSEERDPSTIANNRCVAFTMTKQWDSARTACDRAVREAQLALLEVPSYQIWGRKIDSDYLALALSNRAVLRWASADATAAAADLTRAKHLAPQAQFVERNRAALQYSQSAAPQVAAVPQS